MGAVYPASGCRRRHGETFQNRQAKARHPSAILQRIPADTAQVSMTSRRKRGGVRVGSIFLDQLDENNFLLDLWGESCQIVFRPSGRK